MHTIDIFCCYNNNSWAHATQNERCKKEMNGNMSKIDEKKSYFFLVLMQHFWLQKTIARFVYDSVNVFVHHKRILHFHPTLINHTGHPFTVEEHIVIYWLIVKTIFSTKSQKFAIIVLLKEEKNSSTDVFLLLKFSLFLEKIITKKYSKPIEFF